MKNNNDFTPLEKIMSKISVDTNIPQTSKEHLEEWHRQNDLKITQAWQRKKKRQIFKKASLFSESGVLEHSFSAIDTTDPATKDVATRTYRITQAYQSGEKFNCIFVGAPGKGKTLLASCLLNELYQDENTLLSCLFISTPLFAELALERRRGKDYDLVRKMNHLEKSVKEADILVLDDLGSESSMQIDNIKPANETTQKALFTLSDSRQGKATIITTNYTSSDLQAMYNPKIISRLLTTNPAHILNFDTLPDRRIIQN